MSMDAAASQLQRGGHAFESGSALWMFMPSPLFCILPTGQARWGAGGYAIRLAQKPITFGGKPILQCKNLILKRRPQRQAQTLAQPGPGIIGLIQQGPGALLPERPRYGLEIARNAPSFVDQIFIFRLDAHHAVEAAVQHLVLVVQTAI
jgi:hypothetical protein